MATSSRGIIPPTPPLRQPFRPQLGPPSQGSEEQQSRYEGPLHLEPDRQSLKFQHGTFTDYVFLKGQVVRVNSFQALNTPAFE